MRKLATVLAAALLCAVLPATGSSAAPTTPVPLPAEPRGLPAPVTLPAALDPPSAYVPQVACQPGTPAGVARTRDLVMRTYGVGGRGNTARLCHEGTSEHADGRAWDWMVHVDKPKEKAAAADFLAWLTRDSGANARRLGIMYVIYNAKIWAVYRAQDGWRASSGHRDHVHLSFSWNGARGQTSFWTGAVQPIDHGPCAVFAGQPAVVRGTANPVPCARTVPLVKKHAYGIAALGSRASTVRTAQARLGVTRTGVLDTKTRSAILAWQKANDVPRTGALDVPTWASLVPSKVTSDVTAGFTTAQARTHGAQTFAGLTLARGSAGPAVLFLQKALAMPERRRTGHLGTATLTAMAERQTALGRPGSGTWTGEDWAALAP